MNDISKTLTDMTVFERSSLIETVADALEATADAAGMKAMCASSPTHCSLPIQSEACPATLRQGISRQQRSS